MFRCSREFSVGKTQKVVFHLLSNRISRKILVNGKQLGIKFHHPPCQTPELEGLPRIATHNFFDFYIKKRDLTNLFD